MSDPGFPAADLHNPLADDCRRCPALVDCRTQISWGVGPLDASVVVVGEAPAAGDPDAERWRGGNLTGMAYTARHSGRRIRTLMARVGHPDAYYTNAVKCFPCADDGSGANREPTSDERANCRPYLLEEVAQVAPACVVATGRHATESLLAVEGRTVDSFLDLVLTVQAGPTLGVPVVPLLHPSYQDVWVARLGYGEGEYTDAVRETLASVVG